MKVTLISATPNPDKVVAIAGLMCIKSDKPDDILDNLDKETITKTINAIKNSHHDSVFEHISFTFMIEGISRVNLAQLTRHRLASFSVRSMRYVTVDGNPENFFGFSISEKEILGIDKDSEEEVSIDNIYERTNMMTSFSYKILTEQGMSKENARYILPLSTKTNLIMTMNGREIIHFLGLRMCNRAQAEIRELACRIGKLVLKRAPITFTGLVGPRCVQLGFCPENKRSCGKYVTLDQLKEGYNQWNKPTTCTHP